MTIAILDIISFEIETSAAPFDNYIPFWSSHEKKSNREFKEMRLSKTLKINWNRIEKEVKD